MKKLSGIICAALILGACSSSKNSDGSTADNSQSKAGKGGWQTLFDGKTTNGWHAYNKPDAGNLWVVNDGALTIDESVKSGHGDLVTNEEYGNFDLKMEWKISKNGNSGIIFFVHEDPKFNNTYETGLEMQVLDNEGHKDGKIIKHRAGDLYDLISVSKETVKPVGEWNQVEIVSKDGKLDLYLNGHHSVSTTLWDDNWRNMVANSKFKSMPAFGTYKQGKIALQYHGDKVWFRNIQIKKL